MKPGASEGLQDGVVDWGVEPLNRAPGGLVQEPICVLASDWAQILRHCIFCAQSAISLFPRSFRACVDHGNFPFEYLPYTGESIKRSVWENAWRQGTVVYVSCSLRSKRFRSRHFFTFWRRENRSERNTHCFALAPIFARSKSEKCLKPSESPTETLATQATSVDSQLPFTITHAF